MRKKIALVVLLLVMIGVSCVASAPLTVVTGTSLSLFGFLNSFGGMVLAHADPVPGGGAAPK